MSLVGRQILLESYCDIGLILDARPIIYSRQSRFHDRSKHQIYSLKILLLNDNEIIHAGLEITEYGSKQAKNKIPENIRLVKTVDGENYSFYYC
jgi:hypothetical protein